MVFTYRNRLGEMAHQPEVKASRDYRNAHPGSKRRDMLQIAPITGNVQGPVIASQVLYYRLLSSRAFLKRKDADDVVLYIRSKIDCASRPDKTAGSQALLSMAEKETYE